MSSETPLRGDSGLAPEEAEERYRSIFSAMAAGVVLQDAKGRILFSNPSAHRILGMPANEIFGADSLPTGWQLIRPDGQPFPSDQRPGMRTLRTARPSAAVVMGLRKPDDSVTWISIHSEPLLRGDETSPYAVVTTFEDATEQITAEQQLKRSEELFRTMVENQGEGAGIVDLEERFLFANPAGDEIFGVGRGELIGRSLLDFVSPGHASLIRSETQARIAGRRSEYELEIIRESDHTTRTVLVSATPQMDARGKVCATFGVYRDITDRKLVELALQESEERLRLAAEANRMGTFDIYPQAGKRVWSPVTKRLFGFSSEEYVTYDRFIAAVHPDDRARVHSEVQSMMTNQGNANPASEFRIIRCTDGETRWISSWGRPFFDEQGRPVRLIGIAQDITDRKKAEEEQERLQAQLIQAQKMESIGRLAGGVAHDFNNLLTVINGYSSLALARLHANDPMSEFLREIHNAGEAAAALVRQLLAFGRRQMLRQEPLDLNATVRYMEKTLLPLLGEHVEITTSGAPRLDAVIADRYQIEQVILNLAVNARDAMPEGGKLSLETAPETSGPSCRHCMAPLRPGRYVRLTVRDTGTGMDAATKQHVFEPFFSTKRAGEGTGLGLATVHGIVLQSGGHIDVESEPGKGTAFHVYLPAAEGQAPESRPAEAGGDGSRSLQGSETILLVEDQAEVRNFTAEVLREYGYRVLTAASGEEALAQSGTQPIDLLLTDVIMPKMSGYDLSLRLRALQPGVKVLFMSGYSEEMLAGHAGGMAGAMSIQKPFDAATLAEKVRKILTSRNS